MKKIEKKNVLVLRRPEDEAISLFAGFLANPDMTLSHITILLFSRANRGGTCALGNAPAGGLSLWRIALRELSHRLPALEAGPTSVLLHGGQNLGLVALSRSDFWSELARSATRLLGD